MRAFVEAVVKDETPSVTGREGLQAVVMGLAATRSLRERRPIKLSEMI